MPDVNEFFHKGHTIKVRKLGGCIGWTAYCKEGHAVAAGGDPFGTVQANLARGKKAVNEILSGKRKPFAKPEPIPEADRVVAKRLLGALNSAMRETFK